MNKKKNEKNMNTSPDQELGLDLFTQTAQEQIKVQPEPNKRDYTDKQKEAINTIDANVSVSAGAGSGKTRVLVERFRKIVEMKKANSDEILAITFTKKAAKEMRERVRDTFLKNIDAPNGLPRAFWQEQLSLLDKAPITTIDGLCNRILRENPVEAQLDPNYAIRPEYELTEFKEEVIADFMEAELVGKNPQMFLLLDTYGPQGVKNLLTDLQDNIGAILAEGDLTRGYVYTKAQIEAKQEELLATTDALLAVADQAGKSTQEGLANLQANIAAYQQAIKNKDLAGFNDLVPTLYKNKAIEGEVIAFKEALQDYSQCIIDASATEVVKALGALLKKFADYYHQAQVEKEYYDFGFISAQAVKLLAENPHILERYREKFKYIMVDEFQDTNGEQKSLVYLLAGGKQDKLQDKRLFVVGDGKQSIYRFRGAVVRVFKEVRDDIEATAGNNIVMAENFRSTQEIMYTCNCLFRDLLGNDANADVVAQDLIPQKDKTGPKPLVYVLKNTDQEKQVGQDAEARLIAQSIKELVETNEDLNYGDVAILVPAINLGSRFADALSEMGIGVALTDGKGFYEHQEIIDCYNILVFCLNPRKDLPLLGILRSPYFALDDKILDQLLRKRGDLSLWEMLKDAEQPQAQVAYAKLTALREVADNLSLIEVWNSIYEVLQVETTLLGQEQGREKLANVDKLRGMAVDLATQKSGTLQDFVNQMTILREANAREEAVNVAKGSEAVNIMTIHKSKGLEFPVVVLPALNHGRNSDKSGYRFCPGVGFGIKVDNGSGYLVETSVYQKAKEEINALEKAERIRQLYVAMTRAEKYLLLSTVKEISTTKKNSSSSTGEEKWFDAIERVFTQPENAKLVDWNVLETIQVPELAASVKQNQELSVPETTFERIKPLDSLETQEMVFSASSLQEYDSCPRRFYYNHMMNMPGLEEEVVGDKGHEVSPLVLGLVVHRTLELMQEITQADALARAIKEQEATEQQRKKLQAAAEKLLASYCASDLYKEISGLPQEAEKEFTLELLQLPQGNVSFTGSIDCLLTYPDDTLGIIDFKTGHPPVDGQEKQGYTRQLVIYALAAEKIYGKKVKKAQLHFLQNNSAWELPADRAGEEVKLRELMEKILQQKNEQDYGAQPTNCQYCPYSYFCKK